MTIQMKATEVTEESNFPVMLFIMLCMVVLTSEFVDDIFNLTVQVKATEQYFLMMLFILL